jgi:hypothetical protein
MREKIKLDQDHFEEAEPLFISSLQKSWLEKMMLGTSRTLVNIAELCLKCNHTKYALILLYFLQDHPAILKQDRDNLSKVLEKTEPLLAVREKSHALKEAKSLTMEDLIHSILRSSRRFHFLSDD